MQLKKTATVFVHLLAWLTIAYIFNQVFRVELRTFHILNGRQTENTEVHTFPMLIFLTLSFKSLLFYSGAVPFLSGWLRTRHWVKYGGISALIALFMFLLEWLIITRLEKQMPFLSLIWLDLLLYVITIGVSLTYFLLLEWDGAEKKSRMVIEEQLKTELSFLKAQINPHFFLNTLNNLYSMAQARDIDELEDGILKLSEMMRYILYECQADTVLLNKEIDYIRGYISLTLMRYRQDGNITVNFSAKEQLPQFLIAPVILIPFVENAFKHGISLDKPSAIDINIYVKEHQLFMVVKNTNNATEQANFSYKGIGITNVKRRLEMLYPGQYRLEITNADDFYTVTLQLNQNELRNN